MRSNRLRGRGSKGRYSSLGRLRQGKTAQMWVTSPPSDVGRDLTTLGLIVVDEQYRTDT